MLSPLDARAFGDLLKIVDGSVANSHKVKKKSLDLFVDESSQRLNKNLEQT